MTPRLVVGLFQFSAIAENARNRLKTEGVLDNYTTLKVLKPAVLLRPTAEPKLQAPVGWTH
jgi:hypothetical protein